jgi:hypothetical protein
MSIVWANSDIMVVALIEVIHGLTIYQIHYNKSWRAEKHALGSRPNKYNELISKPYHMSSSKQIF